MNEETLIYYRQAQDSVKNLALLIDESVTKEMIVSCRHACSRYQDHNDRRKNGGKG